MSGELAGGRRLRAGRLLAGVVALALVARLGGILLVGDYHAPFLWDYEVIAKHLVESGYFGFSFEGLPPAPSSFMPPVYPLFLAGIMAIFPGDSVVATKVVQALISGFSVLVTYFLVREIFRHDAVALASAFLAALYPPFIAGALEISTVTPEVLLVQVFALALVRWRRNGRPWPAGLAGLALGLLSLTRAPALLMAPLLSLWMLRAGRDRTRADRWRDLAIFLAATALVIAPWTIRNFLVHEAFVPISTNGGVNFWIGSNPAATGEFVYFMEVAPELFDKAAPLTEVERDALFYEEGFSYIRENPGTYLQLAARKALYFWWIRPGIGSSYLDAGQVFELGKESMVLAYAAVLPLAAIGFLLLRKERAFISLVGLIALPYMLTSLLYFAATRHRSPVEPFLLILASHAIVVGGNFVLRGSKKTHTFQRVKSAPPFRAGGKPRNGPTV